MKILSVITILLGGWMATYGKSPFIGTIVMIVGAAKVIKGINNRK
jgi:hypothetical protein